MKKAPGRRAGRLLGREVLSGPVLDVHHEGDAVGMAATFKFSLEPGVHDGLGHLDADDAAHAAAA